MSDFVIPAPTTPSIPVSGGGAFPVRRVYCIGRNYAAHAIEMGHDPDREAPFFFQKNADNLDPSRRISLSAAQQRCASRSGTGRGAEVRRHATFRWTALGHVWGYAVSLDMTRRDLQGEAKKQGRPWEIGKAFERSGPVGPLHSAEKIGHPDHGRIELKLNGTVKQTGDMNQMIWKVPEMISYLSEYFELQAGDIIMSGTPSGVGAVVRGDVMEASIDGLGTLSVTVV